MKPQLPQAHSHWSTDRFKAQAVLGTLPARRERRVALMKMTLESYREKGRFTPPARKRQGRFSKKAWTYPVVAKGRLYIRDVGILWTYNIKASR